jgi:uncharacterized protein YkwD
MAPITSLPVAALSAAQASRCSALSGSSARSGHSAASRRPGRIVRLAAAPLLALTLLLSLVTLAGPAQAATTRRTAAEVQYGRAVFQVLNAERAANHLPALRFDQRLRLSARWHNLSMARYNTLSHQVPGEAAFTRRISRAGYHWSYAGENIGWNSAMNQRAVVALQKIMYNEKAPNNGHRLNILNRHYRNVGIDVYLDRAHHKVWLTTDFGRP